MLTGVVDLPWWGYVLYTVAMTHVTIAAVTIYLHRHQSHRALELHPVASHAFRFWLWLTTGMVTKEWTAIHRKHHAKCETVEDPHSPQVYGIRTVLLEGAELYRKESANTQTLERYGHGTPDDWMERNVYSRFTIGGIGLLLILDFVLFGFVGVTIWAVQMIWIPFTAAGIVNGVGHYLGYRTFESVDASRNIVPWGILIGGEELHNNHHAFVTSARLASRWYELDIGWLYIRVLRMLGLARVKRIAPTLTRTRSNAPCDTATLHAVITHRYEVLARYARSLRATCAREAAPLRAGAAALDARTCERWLNAAPGALPEAERELRARIVEASPVLAKVYAMRVELSALWQRSAASTAELVQQLEDWCRRAETSGIGPLEAFARALRGYRSQAAA